MRRWNKVIFYMAVIATVFLLPGCAKKNKNEVYTDTIARLDDDELFALVEAGAKYPVLLVTDQYYEDGWGNQASIMCDVYYVVNEEPQKIGVMESLGTAYPIAYDKKGIYTASGHEVWRYVIDEADGVLKLAEGVYETFDENGDAAYTREIDGNVETITEEDYLEAVEKYGKAQVVNFLWGATGT